jgi:hypothetical protein
MDMQALLERTRQEVDIHRRRIHELEDLIQREIDKLKSRSPIPLPDIPNPFR